MDTSNQNELTREPSTASTKLPPIQIDVIEELLKSIGIVHGSAVEHRYRYVISRIRDEQYKVLNAVPWSVDRIQMVLDLEVKYKDWKFVIDHRDVFVNGGWDVDLRLRAEWTGVDTETGELGKQQSRWWPLSKHMVKTEIVQTAFLCVLKAEEHEIREGFKYKDHALFNTHIDIDTLASLSDDVDVRSDPRPEAPKNQRRE